MKTKRRESETINPTSTKNRAGGGNPPTFAAPSLVPTVLPIIFSITTPKLLLSLSQPLRHAYIRVIAKVAHDVTVRRG